MPFAIGRVIGFLRGRVLHQLHPDHVLLDVSGVGYSVHIPVSTYSAIERARAGEPIELFIRTHVREDALDLYGFATVAEKRVFEALIAISGIGPRLAQVILSGMGWRTCSTRWPPATWRASLASRAWARRRRSAWWSSCATSPPD